MNARTLSQFLHGLPAEPVHIAGISFTKPEPLSSCHPHHGCGVYVWIASPGGTVNGNLGPVVFAGTAQDVAKWDFDRQHALEKWEGQGHSQAELAMAVHYLLNASKAELMAVEQRLVALLSPSLNVGASNDAQAH